MRTAALLGCLVLTGAAFPVGAEETPPSPPPSFSPDPAGDADVELPLAGPEAETPECHAPSLRSMIGQMIMIGFPGTTPRQVWPRRIAGMIKDGRIGGVILFSQNVAGSRQVKELIKFFERDAGIRPFIAVDQEGGKTQRLTRAKGFIGLPSARSVSAKDQVSAYRLYRRSADELAKNGVNVNLGPVVDLGVNPRNPAIGRGGRSYARDPKKVISYARQFIDAHGQTGILTAAKHFPGHGSARTDPHQHVVDINRTWSERELDPFRDLVGDDFVDMIMVGHLIHARFSDGDRPASLSKRAMQDVLRGEFGFRGLIVTDDLDMRAIRKRYRAAEAAVMAIAAGADLLMFVNSRDRDPNIADRLIDAISKAVAQGRIDRAAIEQSYRRILIAKKKIANRRAYVMY